MSWAAAAAGTLPLLLQTAMQQQQQNKQQGVREVRLGRQQPLRGLLLLLRA
jgi:hypothetical protein